MKKIIYILLVLQFLVACSYETINDTKSEASQPRIYPDYVDVTIPVNIAPLCFNMADESVLCVDAVVKDNHGNTLHSQGEETIDFDIDEWHSLLDQNRGESLSVTVSAKYEDGWHTYSPFSIHVSKDSIDYGICYRLIEPGYEVWSKMGIYKRELSSFDERALIENTQFEGCVNCHSFNRGNPANMSLHIRGAHGATLIRHNDGPITAYDTKTEQTLGMCVYPYWHPSGRYIAYSTNNTNQLFHNAGHNRVEVFDTASDLQVYDVEKNELLLSPLLKQDSIYETYPVFSADGRSLYFCSAAAIPENSLQLDSIRYNLCRIDFNPATGCFGNQIETIIDAVTMNKSVSFPRPSYDGKFLCYTLSDYGQFSIWHHEADLYLLDLSTGESRPMKEANSEDTESFHNWSTNSRWILFCSKRHNGVNNLLYFAHVDSTGRASKAFLLPQQNPGQYYRSLMHSYNVPDFTTEKVELDVRDFADEIFSRLSHRACALFGRREGTASAVPQGISRRAKLAWK